MFSIYPLGVLGQSHGLDELRYNSVILSTIIVIYVAYITLVVARNSTSGNLCCGKCRFRAAGLLGGVIDLIVDHTPCKEADDKRPSYEERVQRYVRDDLCADAQRVHRVLHHEPLDDDDGNERHQIGRDENQSEDVLPSILFHLSKLCFYCSHICHRPTPSSLSIQQELDARLLNTLTGLARLS